MHKLRQAFKVLSAGIHSLSVNWICWIYFMVFVNGIIPLFFLPKFTAIIVLASSMTGFLLGLILTHAMGYSKILGLMHFPWIPMVFYQIYYLSQFHFKIESTHELWLTSSLVVSLLSLLMDFYDVCTYLMSPET